MTCQEIIEGFFKQLLYKRFQHPIPSPKQKSQ